jgi:uncharacterized protein YkwD
MNIDRRRLITAGGIAILMPLSGCASGPGVGNGAGDSAAGARYLAAIRASNGLTALTADPSLEKAALRQAGYMARAGRMDHTTGWGRDFASRMKDDGIGGAAAENIAHGDIDLDELFSRWMNSAGHRRNMLDPRFSRFGLAYTREAGSGNRRYWALVLAS